MTKNLHVCLSPLITDILSMSKSHPTGYLSEAVAFVDHMVFKYVHLIETHLGQFTISYATHSLQE